MNLSDTDWFSCQSQLESSARKALASGQFQGRFDVADVVQEGLLQIWNADDISITSAWLYHVGRGHALGEVRRHTTAKRDVRRDAPLSKPVSLGADPPDVECAKQEIACIVRDAIDSLHPMTRYVVKKHAMEGYPLKSVAESLGRTPKVCRTMLNKALQHLRAVIIEAIGHLTGEHDRPVEPA